MAHKLTDSIAVNFPDTKDCLNGHLGPEIRTLERELDDDRYQYLLVTRCEHCNIPLREKYVDKLEDLDVDPHSGMLRYFNKNIKPVADHLSVMTEYEHE